MERNTVQYMKDEMQETTDAQSAELVEEKQRQEEEKKKKEEEIKRYEEEQKRHEEEQKKHEEEQKRHDEENNKLLEMITAQAAALEKALKRIEELERKNGSESAE